MNILGIIPARGGSKGIPGKNIKLLNGIPLIGYTIKEAKKSKFLNKIIVSTDDENIAKVSKSFNAEVPFLRPKELALDSSPTIDCIIHAINWEKNNENYNPDYVCVLQCTSPLRTYEDIDNVIKLAVDKKGDGAVSVCESEVNPYWTNVINEDGKLKYFIEKGRYITKRQDLPPVYRINGAVWVTKTEKIIKERTLEPKDIYAYVMRPENSIDIDNEIDFKIAELILKSI